MQHQLEYDLVVGRLRHNIHNLTAEQALGYIAHAVLAEIDGVYLYGLRRKLPEDYPHFNTSDTQITAGFIRLIKWELLHPPVKVTVGGQGRPRDMYRRVDTPSATEALRVLAAAWEDAPWNTTQGTKNV